jgi:peptidoglycan L-alanyl-D-glutamate endopeptidase CwlK
MKVRNKYQFGNSSNTRKSTVSKYLQITADRAILCSPVDFGVPWMGGKRTTEEQQDIFAQGYSRADGVKVKSYHQSGNAIDLVPYIPGIGYAYDAQARFGVIGMLMLEAWEELQDEGTIPKNLYLHWGGFWSKKAPKNLGWDLAHYEIRNKPQVEQI